MGRTKLPRTLESNSRDPLSAAKPYMYVYIYILFLAMMIMMKMMMMMMVVMIIIYPILDYIWTLYNIH